MKRKIAQSEGDVNSTPARQKWQAENLSDHTRQLLEEDAKYFLRQSLSTPCLNALKSAEGAYIQTETLGLLATYLNAKETFHANLIFC